LAILITYFTKEHYKAKVIKVEWLLLVAGSLVVIISYVEDYLQYMLSKFQITDLFGYSTNTELILYASNYLPNDFSWWIFILGGKENPSG